MVVDIPARMVWDTLHGRYAGVRGEGFAGSCVLNWEGGCSAQLLWVSIIGRGRWRRRGPSDRSSKTCSCIGDGMSG